MGPLNTRNVIIVAAPLPENTIEIPIVRVGSESFEDAVRDVMAYLTDRCVRLGIHRIQFVCQETGRSAEWVMERHPDAPSRDPWASTKEASDVAS
ncbi:MAG: hypothetical protein HY710_15615 [Candidatus Latescibacteria bacterium]|nr:hypothetical protein [Candidatus Latescibacterota bacterium]